MSGALAVFAAVEPGSERAFECWHTAEHLPERLAVTGIRRARRFASVPGTPANWLMLYDADDPGVFASQDYLARIAAPTPRTARVLATVTSTFRIAATVRLDWHAATGVNRGADGGTASGGFVAAWRLEAPPQQRSVLYAWLYEAGPAAAAAAAGVVRFAVLEAEDSAPSCCDLLLLVEGDSLSAVAEVCQALQPLQSHGAATGDVLGFLTLQVELAG